MRDLSLSRLHRQLMVLIAVMWGIAGLTAWYVLDGDVGASGDGTTLAATQLPAAYDYTPATLPAGEVEHPREDLEAAASQWPASPKARMESMSERLLRVSDAINAAAGSHCVVMLGQTHRAALSHGDGRITLDTTMLWRLSEDALAALIAHEVAHEALGHHYQFERLAKEKGQPGAAQRERALELAADEYAGRLIARAGYRPEGFSELLRHVRSTDWETPLVRQYYPHVRRATAFQQAYDAARTSGEPGAPTGRKELAAASRPADDNPE